MIYGNMKEGKYEINGIKLVLMTEVTSLLHCCFKRKVFDKDDMQKMVELAVKSPSEVKKEAEELGVNIMSKIIKDALNGNEAAKDVLSMILEDEE